MKEMVKIIWVNVIYFGDIVFRFKSLDTKTLIVCVCFFFLKCFDHQYNNRI